jgi:hypothetical protein
MLSASPVQALPARSDNTVDGGISRGAGNRERLGPRRFGGGQNTRSRGAKIGHGGGAGVVVGRSASLLRLGLRRWEGDREAWSETTIFVNNSSLG